MKNREKTASPDPDDEIRRKIFADKDLVDSLHKINFAENFSNSEPTRSVILVSSSKTSGGLGKTFR